MRNLIKNVIVGAGLLLIACTGTVSAQSLQDLAGAWKLVSVVSEHQGKTSDMYGPHPRGILTIEANGRYVLVVARAHPPKVASHNRTTATDDENKAIVSGSIAHFGTLTVDSANKTLDFRIETSTFPNWDGIDQKRAFTVHDDELRYTVAAGSAGTSSALVWKRIP